MNFWDPSNLASVLNGEWVVEPAEEQCELDGVGIDTRQSLTKKIYFAIRGERFDGHDFLVEAAQAGAAMLLVDRRTSLIIPPGVAILRVEDTRLALGQLAAAYRNTLQRTVVIAITGSAGKTTTRDLVHHILKQALHGTTAIKSYNNDIGVPLTILSAAQDDNYLVLEIGTNAPGEIAALTRIARPDIAVITSIGRAHLEGLGSLEGVREEKLSMLSHLNRGAIAILPQAFSEYAPDQTNYKILTFGKDRSATFYLSDRGRVLSTSETASIAEYYFELNNSHKFHIALPGEHNATNATAAIMVANQFGLPFAAIRRALKSATPPAMRMTQKEIGDVVFYNDAYNANPDSMQASLLTFKELTRDVTTRRVLILGEMRELGIESESFHREIGRFIAENSVLAHDDLLITVGHEARAISETLRHSQPGLSNKHFATLEPSSIESIHHLLIAGDRVLLKGSRSNRLEQLLGQSAGLSHTQAVTMTP